MSAGAWARLAPVVAALALSAACTTTSTTSTSAAPPVGRTTSDEPDPQRRAQARLELAAAYYGRNQLQTALEQVRLALAVDPTYGDAYSLRGLIYAALGDPGLAEESFRRAMQINPRDADAMHNLGWTFCQQQRYAEAHDWFVRANAVPQYRGQMRTLLAMGVCQARSGDLAAAEASLVRAYEFEPGNPVTATNLSEVLYRRGDYERARFYIRRVNAMREVANAQTLWLAARIENRIGNRQGTENFGNQLRSRFPDSREAADYARGNFDD